MEDIILLLYVKNPDYGKRLLRFLISKKNPRIHPELVTERRNMEYRVGTEKETLVILTDQTGICEKEKRRVLQLANQQDRKNGMIFQYQKAEAIYQELLWQLDLQQEQTQIPGEKEEEPEHGVYSVLAADGDGATVLAATMTQYLGQSGQCLYLFMGAFPVFYEGTLRPDPDMSRPGMGELFFELDRPDFRQRENQLRMEFGNAWMLPPVQHFKDYLDCSKEDWSKFLRRLKEDCQYDSIVVEIGMVCENTMDFLSESDCVFLLQQKGVMGQVRGEVYKKYCAIEKREDLWAKTVTIETDDELRDWESEFEKEELREISNNKQKMERIKQWMRGGQENVCIWEGHE